MPFWNGRGDGVVEGTFHNLLAELTLSYHFFLRYRSTAVLVLLILVAGWRSPHRTLDFFVNKSTNFTPTDGRKWCANEPNLVGHKMENFWVWNFERLST